MPNSSGITEPVRAPLLYLRGAESQGDIDDYLAGFRRAGVTDVRPGVVPGAGHFTAEEAPEATWSLLAEHLAG